MKRMSVLTIMVLLVLLASPARAGTRSFNLGVEAGYFGPNDSDFSEIYGSGGLTLGVNAAYRLLQKTSIQMGFNFFSADGKSALSEEDVSVNLKTLRVGGYYHFNLGKIVPRAGAGLAVTWFKESDPWGGTNKTKAGWFAGAGADVPIGQKFLAGLEILYKDIKIEGEFAAQSIGGLSLLLNFKVEL
jgi:opacity protein-like surface antigen